MSREENTKDKWMTSNCKNLKIAVMLDNPLGHRARQTGGARIQDKTRKKLRNAVMGTALSVRYGTTQRSLETIILSKPAIDVATKAIGQDSKPFLSGTTKLLTYGHISQAK